MISAACMDRGASGVICENLAEWNYTDINCAQLCDGLKVVVGVNALHPSWHCCYRSDKLLCLGCSCGLNMLTCLGHVASDCNLSCWAVFGCGSICEAMP